MIKDSLEKIGQKYQGFIEWWKDYVKVLILSYTRIARDNVSILASGMVYSTLISIVPCIAFLFAFFYHKFFPFFARVIFYIRLYPETAAIVKRLVIV